MKNVIYINSSGNITALINDKTKILDINKYAKRIISSSKAEQVAIKTKPKLGGDCRLDMLGGEFCGNAVRGYGYYYFINSCNSIEGILDVEISGATKPLKVNVNTSKKTSYVSMPNISLRSITKIVIEYNSTKLEMPLIKMPGIAHVLVDLETIDNKISFAFTTDYKHSSIIKDIINSIINNKKLDKFDAVGIMFLDGSKIYPYVEVKNPSTKVWESSCGSGTYSCFYYILVQIVSNRLYELSNDKMLFNGIYKKLDTGYYFEKTYIEPGGNITLKATINNNKIKEVLMGGEISIS